MNTFTFTDQELGAIKQAVEQVNDMMTDCFLEDVDLFPSPDHPQELTYENAKVIREEIYEAAQRLVAVRTLMTKLGLKTNDKGYSV